MNTVQIRKTGSNPVIIALSPYDTAENFGNWQGIGSYTKDINLYGGTTLYDEDGHGASKIYYEGNKREHSVSIQDSATVNITLQKERVRTGREGNDSRFDRTIARIHIGTTV